MRSFTSLFRRKDVAASVTDKIYSIDNSALVAAVDMIIELATTLREHLPQKVSQTPRKLMGELFQIQGIRLDPRNLDPAVQRIVEAVGNSDGVCDGTNSYDVFINYRVVADAEVALKLYLELKAKGVHAFLDKKCLRDGEPWKDGFLTGLSRSRKFICLISSAALTNVRDETKDHTWDNVLKEYETALLMRDRLQEKDVNLGWSYIVPVFVGAYNQDGLLKWFGDFNKMLYPDSVGPVGDPDATGALVSNPLREAAAQPVRPLFQGHEVTFSGISVDPSTLTAIAEMKGHEITRENAASCAAKVAQFILTQARAAPFMTDGQSCYDVCLCHHSADHDIAGAFYAVLEAAGVHVHWAARDDPLRSASLAVVQQGLRMSCRCVVIMSSAMWLMAEPPALMVLQNMYEIRNQPYKKVPWYLLPVFVGGQDSATGRVTPFKVLFQNRPLPEVSVAVNAEATEAAVQPERPLFQGHDIDITGSSTSPSILTAIAEMKGPEITRETAESSAKKLAHFILTQARAAPFATDGQSCYDVCLCHHSADYKLAGVYCSVFEAAGVHVHWAARDDPLRSASPAIVQQGLLMSCRCVVIMSSAMWLQREAKALLALQNAQEIQKHVRKLMPYYLLPAFVGDQDPVTGSVTSFKDLFKNRNSATANVQLPPLEQSAEDPLRNNPNKKRLLPLPGGASENDFEEMKGALSSLADQMCDDILSDVVRADFPRLLVDLAKELGEKAWGRSKIMFVGPGRAGKTGTERAIMGQPFENTDSTTGINDEWTCEVTYDVAHVDGEDTSKFLDRWTRAEKVEKGEYVAEVAKLATDIKEGKVEKEIKAGQDHEQQLFDAEDNHKENDDWMEQDEEPNGAAAEATQKAVVGTFRDAGSDAVPSGDGPARTTASDGILLAPVRGLEEGHDEDAVRLVGERQMNSKLLITMLDFGGQKVFDAIHQFFLTEYAVYMVVFNMECYLTHADPGKVDPTSGVTTWVECLKNVKQWVGSVVVHTMNSCGRSAPIFIVGTHKDIVSSTEDHRAISKELIRSLGEDSPAMTSLQQNDREGLQYFPLDNTRGRSDPTMKDMMKLMEAVIEEEEYVKQKRPLLWFRVLDWINSQDRSFLTYDEVAKYARQSGFDTKALDDMLRMFHESSALMWHREEGLRHLVIREPIAFFVTPATNVICQHTGTATDKTVHELPEHILAKVRNNSTLTADFKKLKNTGIVTRGLLEVLLGGGEHWKVVELLMVKYALLVPLRRDDGEASDADPRYLVPALLPEAEHDDVNDDTPTGIRFFFHFSASTIKGSLRLDKGFLPSGLFARVLGVVLAWSQETTVSQENYWSCHRHGMTVYFGSQRFKLSHRPEINSIEVQLFGAGTPLAVHARLKTILGQLIEQCFKSLHCVTLLEFTAGGRAQGPAIRPSTPTDVRPLFIPLDDIRNLIAKRIDVLALARGIELRASHAVDLYGQSWAPDAVASEVAYDVFISYRWGEWDTAFTAKLEDHLRHYTVGEDAPQPMLTFLDVLKLELGVDFKEAFVKALTRSKVVVPIVSHDALAKMMALTHDPTGEDNVLIEWLCAKYCLKHGIVKRILPIFFGKRTALDTFGGDFFDKDENNLTVLQSLATCDATATVKRASQLLMDAGVLDSNVAVEPSVFGLTSFAVRDIVAAITNCNGIFAKNFSSMLQLLQKCGGESKKIISECAGGIPQAQNDMDGRITPVAAALEGFDAAWAVLHDARFISDATGLQAFLADGYERDMMDTWDQEVVDLIKAFLNGGGKRAFESKWRKAMEKK